MEELLVKISTNVSSRFELWAEFLNIKGLKYFAEIGVYKGDFAKYMLENCQLIQKYHMVDPWRNLPDWNKPANKDNSTFNAFYQETIQKTLFAQEKIIIHKGTTIETSVKLDDNSIDFIYIDGDHTLRGICIDLINYWSKIKDDGFIAGDDFSPSIWQHAMNFEPTFVFPFAIYFAEAMKATIYGLPFGQFLIEKQSTEFKFFDLTKGVYKDRTIINQFRNLLT